MLLLVMMGLFMRLRVPPDNMVQDDINAIWGPEALFHDNAQEELPPDEEFEDPMPPQNPGLLDEVWGNLDN